MRSMIAWAALAALLTLAGCPQSGNNVPSARAAPDQNASRLPAGVYRGELRYTATFRIGDQPLSSNTERESRVLTINADGVPLRPDTGAPESVGASASAQSTGFRITETTRAIRLSGSTVTVEYDVVIAYEQLPGTNEPFTLRGLQTIRYTLLEDGHVLMELELDAATDLAGEIGALTLKFLGDGLLRRS